MQNLSLSNSIYKNKSFNAIDLFKFIFAIAIIYLHYPIFKSNPTFYFINNSFARLGVPFFFIASSYFFFKKIKYQNESEKKINLIKYLKKMITMYILWSILSLPLMIDEYKSYTLLYSIRKLLLVGTYRQFWFLLTLIIDIPILYFLNKKIKPQISLLVGIILFLFGTIYFEFFKYVINIPLLNNIYTILSNFFITVRNFLFFGFCFIAIGNFFAHCEFKISMPKAICILILTTITLLLENYFFTKTSVYQLSDMRISLLPLSFILFYILAHIDLKDRKIYSLLRNMSTFIYCSHCICAEIGGLLNIHKYIASVSLSVTSSFLYVKLKTHLKTLKSKNLKI